MAMAAKVQQVTQLLGALKKDQQEKHLNPAGECQGKCVTTFYSWL